MHVLLVTSHFYRRAGAETYVLALGAMLERHGHRVSYFSMNHPQNLPSSESRFFVDHIDFAELNERKSLKNGMRVLSRSIYSTQARSKIRELIEELKPDIAHVSNIHGHITPSILFELRKWNIPVVWTLHDFRLLCPDIHFISHGIICEECKGGRFYRCVLKRCKKSSLAASLVASLEAYVHKMLRVRDKADVFIAPSRLLKDKFIEHGLPSDKMVFIRNFLPEAPLASDSALAAKHALYVGQMTQQKGVRTLIDAAALCPDIPIKLAGRGPLEAEIREAISVLGLKNVTMLGHVSGSEVMKLAQESAYLVFPSVWYENCPYSIMEAQSLGKPIIASKIGGPMEMIDDGQTGMFFEPGDAQGLATAMKYLWQDQDNAARLGKNAAEFARTEYDHEHYYSELMKTYEGALSLPANLIAATPTPSTIQK